MLQLGSDSVQRRSMKSMLLMGQKWVALGLIGVIKCQTGFKLSSYWGKHVLHSVQNGSFLAGTYLHTHILPVYHFVLDFLICCPRRGQNGIPTGDKNQGQGQHPCTPRSLALLILATIGIFWGIDAQRVVITLIQILEDMVTPHIKVF